jgi:hypothetical protein
MLSALLRTIPELAACNVQKNLAHVTPELEITCGKHNFAESD